MPAIELPPFTDTHREAVRRCRFLTVNLARTVAWVWTDDAKIVACLVPTRAIVPSPDGSEQAKSAHAVGSATRYRRSADPDKHEWEITITHPDGVAFICDLVDGRDA